MEQAATNNKFQSPRGARNEKVLAAAHEAPAAAEVRINSAATPSLAGRSADSGPYRLITAEYSLGGGLC